MNPPHVSPRQLLLKMFEAAIGSAQPAHCVPPHLPSQGAGRTIVIGAGKASAAMARALEQSWAGPLSGLVVTRYGYAVPCQRIEIVEAAHPVPDEAGLRAAGRMMELVGGLTLDDTVICLISGGGSSLLPLPLDGITLEDKQLVNRALLASGATIGEMNTVRRHLSAIKGGRLAAACHPARVVTLLISDVPGDRPCDIASGPTVGDPTTCADALAIVKRYGIELPAAVREVLESGRGESVKPGDPVLSRCETRMIATPQMALEAAAAVAREAGITPYILGNAIEGEARDVGKAMAGMARQVAGHGQPFARPCVMLSGGETTVTVRPGPRRTECRIFTVAGTGAGGPSGGSRAGRGYRWRRWPGRDRGRGAGAGFAGAGLGAGNQARRCTAGQRRARLLRGAGGFGGDWADADECERFSGGAD